MTPNPVTLMGVSFGGMMAIEMAKWIPVAKVIIISSVKSRKELPAGTKLAAAIGLYRLVPSRQTSWMRSIGNHFLGAGTEEEIRLSNEFMEKVDPVYLHWAIRQVMRWKNEWQPPVLYHIHGTKDRTFPFHRVCCDPYRVEGGGHFMVLNRAKEMNSILADIALNPCNISGMQATYGRQLPPRGGQEAAWTCCSAAMSHLACQPGF